MIEISVSGKGDDLLEKDLLGPRLLPGAGHENSGAWGEIKIRGPSGNTLVIMMLLICVLTYIDFCIK